MINQYFQQKATVSNGSRSRDQTSSSSNTNFIVLNDLEAYCDRFCRLWKENIRSNIYKSRQNKKKYCTIEDLFNSIKELIIFVRNSSLSSVNLLSRKS